MGEPAFQRVEELFHRAAEVSAERRAAFLDAACGGDAALRAAVQELLDHDAADDSDFLASPVARPRGGSDAPTLPAPPGAFCPTPTVPGYEIAEEVGRGGMGVVFKARQLSLDRIVALKMLLPPAPGDPKPLARFRAEAEILARLRHPNIVTIYDFGEYETRPYFTMEYVPGPNLARFLDRRPQTRSPRPGSSKRWRGPPTPPTRPASSTATSSRPTSCSHRPPRGARPSRPAGRASPTSAWPGTRRRRET